MPRRFEMREPVTGRLLGTLDLVEDKQPGDAVRTFFRLDAVQLEVHPDELVGRHPLAGPSQPTERGRRGRR